MHQLARWLLSTQRFLQTSTTPELVSKQQEQQISYEATL